MTFLSVYTPTYKRPKALEKCKRSVTAQTVPVEHVIIPDEIGVGIAGVFAAIPDHANDVHGDYVMVLSDDNVLADKHFAEELENVADKRDQPDVIVFKGVIGPTTQPAAWKQVVETMIDLSCFAVQRDVWQANADKWGHRYEGDYDFIRSLWDQGYRFHWWDRLGFRALRISAGAAE